MGFLEGKDYYHMAGFSNNYWVHQLGQPLYKPWEFLTYNTCSLQLPIKHEPYFYKLQQDIEEKHGKGADETIKRFFPIIEEVEK